MQKPVLLCILDGWGYRKEKEEIGGGSFFLHFLYVRCVKLIY